MRSIRSLLPGRREGNDGDERRGEKPLDDTNVFAFALVDLVELLHRVEREESVARLGPDGERAAVLIEVDEEHVRPRLPGHAR